MMFNIDDYKGKYVMHCKTEEEAEVFCRYLDSIGRRWKSNDSYLSENYWDNYEESTCYDFNTNTYFRKQYFEKDGYTILEMEDFMNKEEKKPNCSNKTGIDRSKDEIVMAYRIVAKHIFLAQFDDITKYESSREIIILADDIDEARQKAQNFLGLSSVTVRAVNSTDDAQIYEL